jgi:hypothetical protein
MGDNMTLLKSLLTLSLLAAPIAQAQYGVGIGIGIGENNYGPIDEPARPGRPGGPERPGRPERPEYPGRPGGNRVQKTAYVGRSVRNENLPLRQLAGLGREYRGYTIDSVELYLRPSRYSNARVALMIDRIAQDERTVTIENFVVLNTSATTCKTLLNYNYQLYFFILPNDFNNLDNYAAVLNALST